MKDIKLLGFAMRGKRRKETLLLISKEKQISQAQIMKKLEQYKSHNSTTIKELKDKKLIECVNPEDRTYKFYKLTKLGKDIVKEIKENYN